MTSVNRPTNVKQKEQDVNNKLQLYGIFTAFSNGKVPSNEQIDVALNSFMKQSFMTTPSKKLSAEGQDLVKDFRDVVEAAKVLLLTKNHGNLLQDFIWESQNIDGANASTPNAPIDKETANQHGNQALGGLRTLGTLIVSNGQFRKLLNDATILLRDMAGDAAQKAANKVNPSEDDLKQIDRPADDNTWHDVPDMSKDNIKNQLKDAYNKNAPVTGQDLKDAAGDASQEAHPSGSRDPRDVGQPAARDQQYNTSSGVDAASGAASGLQTLKDRANQNIPDERKDQARELKETSKNKTKNYLSKKMPKERRDQTIWRLKKMLVEIQGHPDYSEAITTLLSLAEEYTGHSKNVTGQAVNSVQDAHGDTSLQRAEYDLKTLIERFANNTSTNDLFDSINNLYRDADRDPELKNWFKRLDAFIRKCLQQQGYVLEDRATDEYNELYDRGNFLLRDRYRNHTDRVLDEFKFLGDQFDKDPLNRRFADACQKLFEDLGNDENGQPTFKPHLVKDLTEVILPAAFESVRYVPVPRIEYSDPTIDAIVENLVIESDNLTPNLVEFASDNYWRWGRKGIANRNKNAVMISVSGVQMDLRDVSYYVKKKQGFPGITDLGVADIFLGGSGFSFKIRVETADAKDRHNFFKVNKVDVDVKNFNIKLKQSRHKTLFALSKPIMLKVMRPALQKVLEKVIRDKFFELDQLLYSIKQEADRATAEAKDDPENIPNLYSRYTSAAQKKIFEGKKKAQEVTADKEANVAMTQHDSIFPDIKLPGGISSKATEYKELAAKGDKWQSPIFTIGSANTSSNLPSTAPEVSHKDHNVTQGGVRGPQNIGQTEPASKQLNDATPSGLGAGAGTTGFGAAGTTNGKYTNGGHTNGHSSTTNGTTAFSNQVDQAFSKPTAGATTTPAAANGVTKNTGTTLGANNPVFNGTAR